MKTRSEELKRIAETISILKTDREVKEYLDKLVADGELTEEEAEEVLLYWIEFKDQSRYKCKI